jgi:DNA-binding MarR family transcriptional regulator
VAREANWLDERQQRAWRGFIQMSTLVRADLARRMAETGLSEADYAVLVALSEAPNGRLRPHELWLAAGWEKSRLSHQVRRMEERGLVTREACATDNRGSLVALTRKGRAAIAKAAPSHVDDVREIFVDRLTPEQLDALAGIADVVLAGLETTCSQVAEQCAEDEDLHGG